MFAEWEWMIMLVLALAALVWELLRTRRAMRDAGDKPRTDPRTTGHDAER